MGLAFSLRLFVPQSPRRFSLLRSGFSEKMADEDWQKVRKIFDSALRRKPEERQKYLVQTCGSDKSLLAEVESLLASLNSAESFLETSVAAKVAEAMETSRSKFEKGTSLGHYEIIKQIGAGGMGNVYLAQDKKLGRQVAIKILNEKFERHQSNLNRFIKEAKSASALNHPNIIVIHEIGEARQTHYIVSEFIKGKTLRQVVQEKPLKLPEILDIAIQTAGALTSAHEIHLIHRDIKPENIMIRPDGFLKVLDFGLAKLVERKNQPFLGLENSTVQYSQTGKGVILGTVSYMSPEQAKGERVDERTDIFSLGVLVYEMVTGRTPFAGNSTSETFANLINQESQPLSHFVPNVPEELQRIVGKMLLKNADERYQTMKELLTDLKQLRENLSSEENMVRSHPSHAQATAILWATTGDVTKQTAGPQNSLSMAIKRRPLAAIGVVALLFVVIKLGIWYFLAKTSTPSLDGKKSIAVLPLKPINTANRDEIYEIGIADSLIYRLNLMRGFVVRPLSATRKYADITQDPLAAGKEQQADFVLAANYQVAGGRIRITAELFNVQSGQLEDTFKIEKETSDVFAMQDAVDGEVGKQLQARFVTTSGTPLATRGTTNEEAYRLYLQGKNLTAQRSAADAKKAIEHFEQAIKLDPNFARAYSGMAFAFRASGTLGGGAPREQFEKAKAAVTKALELDSNLAEAYTVRGDLTQKYEWDWAGAEKDFLRAIELEPNNDLAHNVYSTLLAESGRFSEAMTELDIAQTINPVSLVYQRDRGRFLYFARRYDEAIVQLKRVLEIDENFPTAYGWLWQAHEMKGDHAGAAEWFMKWQKQANPQDIELLQQAYETAGWSGVKQKRLELDKQNEHQPGSNLFGIARLCALLGEKEQAFDYLNKAAEKRQSQLVMLNSDPTFDSLRSDPRFTELLRRVGLK